MPAATDSQCIKNRPISRRQLGRYRKKVPKYRCQVTKKLDRKSGTMELSNKFDDDVEDVDDEDGDDDDARKGNGNGWLSAFNIFLAIRPKAKDTRNYSELLFLLMHCNQCDQIWQKYSTYDNF